MSVESAALAQVEALCAALARALSGDASVQWSGQTLYRDAAVVPLVAAHQSQVAATLADQRALLDGVALRLRLSDVGTHARHQPLQPVERLVYELLEQLRVESCVPPEWPGVDHNLGQRFLRWCDAFVDSGLAETSLGILLLSVAVAAWSRFSGKEVPQPLADLLEATRARIAPQLGVYLAQLRQQRRDQRAFAPIARDLSLWVGQMVQQAQDQAPLGVSRRGRNGFALPLPFDAPQPPPPPTALGGHSRAWAGSGSLYRVFTRAYDRELDAASLVRSAQLRQLRQQMDEQLSAAGFNVARLARVLQRALATPRRDGWRFGQDSGYIDASRLARLCVDAHDTAIFKDEPPRALMASAVTILLDCSGSMKTHAVWSSLLVDVLGRALDMAGVRVEILGFSTAAWNGGRARKDWQRAACPQWPGRMNEVLHMVFKAGAQSWRRGRLGLAALRRLDLFREGLDGEAVAWACQRLRAQPAKRRVLLVVSDGSPMDTATSQCNDQHYLAQHLKQVVAANERRRDVAICALGLGLDLGPFYRRRLAIDARADLDESTLLAVAELLCRAGQGVRAS